MFFNKSKSTSKTTKITKTFDANGHLISEESEVTQGNNFGSNKDIDLNTIVNGQINKLDHQLLEEVQKRGGQVTSRSFEKRSVTYTKDGIKTSEEVEGDAKIKCPFCGTVFLSSQTNCPSCGGTFDPQKDAVYSSDEKLDQMMRDMLSKVKNKGNN